MTVFMEQEAHPQQAPNLPVSFKKKKIIYLAAPGLGCGTAYLQSSLWHADSLVVARRSFSCGMRTLSCRMCDLVP